MIPLNILTDSRRLVYLIHTLFLRSMGHGGWVCFIPDLYARCPQFCCLSNTGSRRLSGSNFILGKIACGLCRYSRLFTGNNLIYLLWNYGEQWKPS
jgi:hypothetical protein